METQTSKNKEIDNDENCDVCWISNFAPFKDCSEEVRNEIASNSEIRKYDKGACLIKEGAAGIVFCIQYGLVKVSKKNNRNKEFILWIAGKGDVIGLNSFIDDEPFSYSATAIDQVVACALPATGLKNMMLKEPVASMQLMKCLCEQLDFAEHRITCFSGKNIREHSAEVLIALASKCEPESDEHFYINCSIKDLASLIGTTRSYLYKVLADFTEKKILSIQNRAIIIHHMNALSSIATGKE